MYEASWLAFGFGALPERWKGDSMQHVELRLRIKMRSCAFPDADGG